MSRGTKGKRGEGGSTSGNLPIAYSNTGSRGGSGGANDMSSARSALENHPLTSLSVRSMIQWKIGLSFVHFEFGVVERIEWKMTSSRILPVSKMYLLSGGMERKVVTNSGEYENAPRNSAYGSSPYGGDGLSLGDRSAGGGSSD